MIRTASRDDITAIAALHRSALHKEWSHQSFEGFITSVINTLWVAEHNAVIIGFIITQTAPDETEIISLAVSPEHRRTGIASSLMQKLSHPCFLEVREDNLPAIRFYQHHGFTEVGRRKNYYSTPAGKQDALIMRS